MRFLDFGLSDTVQQGVEALGFNEPTPIQEKAIPIIMEGRDVLGSAQTGTGKTAAFLLPIIDHIVREPGKGIRALIIAPTRELAQQIDRQLQGLAYFSSVSHLAVYGGTGGFEYEQEKKAFKQGVDIIVATPGRLLVHLAMEAGTFSQLEFLVLDEADRMLDMGFYDDIMRIISYLPKKRQNLLFSATMPPKIMEMAKKVLVEPHHINIALSKPAEGIMQAAYLVDNQSKIGLIRHLLHGKSMKSVLIFAATKTDVKVIEQTLRSEGLDVASMHSDHDQKTRGEIMLRFSNRQVPVVVATDILSRGIDVDGIELVLNYNVPKDAEDYVHRIGRTARAGQSGMALTFINAEELGYFQSIERLLGYPVYKVALPQGLTGPNPNELRHRNPKSKSNHRRFKNQKPKTKNK